MQNITHFLENMKKIYSFYLIIEFHDFCIIKTTTTTHVYNKSGKDVRRAFNENSEQQI